jgi:hypothetical protein
VAVFPTPGIFEKLQQYTQAEIVLVLDMDSLLATKYQEDYLAGTFQLKDGKKTVLSLPVSVRQRGKYRRMRCEFPPLKMKLDEDALVQAGYSAFGTFKIVNQCMDTDPSAKELLLREYLVYQLYQELSELSLRTLLVRITYRNERSGESRVQLAILMEDDEQLAARHGYTLVDPLSVPQADMIPADELRVALFQYMIGNVDWGYQPGRNIEILFRGEGEGYVPIPYDFDFSAIVAAPYAVPKTHIGQRNIKERVFFGRKTDTAALQEALSWWMEKEKGLRKKIRETKQLSLTARLEMEEYMDGFFDLLSRPAEAAEVLFSRKPWLPAVR